MGKGKQKQKLEEVPEEDEEDEYSDYDEDGYGLGRDLLLSV